MWPRCCFGVVLHRKSFFVFNPNAFNAVIVEVHMRYLNLIIGLYGIRLYAKAMVLGSDFAFTRKQVFNRVI